MSDETEQFDLPGPLTSALRQGYTHRLEIPAAVEQTVLSAAHGKFAQRRRMRLLARWGTGLAAGIAAMIVLVVWLHHPAANALVVKGDIDGDGKVNIVDALVLAKHIAGKDKAERGWDVNGDGVADQKDVDALAQAAVSLKGGGVAQRSLPTLHELGIDRVSHVGFASANEMGSARNTLPLAVASPAKNAKEEPR